MEIIHTLGNSVKLDRREPLLKDHILVYLTERIYTLILEPVTKDHLSWAGFTVHVF